MATLRHIVAELEKMREEIKDLKEKVNVTVYILGSFWAALGSVLEGA